MKTFEDGDPCFAPMLNALFAAFRGTAVMGGCEASATGTSRTVSITAGTVQINGEVIAVEAGSVTLDAGSTFDRYDLVSVNASGSKIVTKGATKRKCPTQPANTCLLAIVFVPAGATVVTSGNVYDARMLSPLLAAAAIECAGAIHNQTGNIGARSQFVDVAGDIVRKEATGSWTIAVGSTDVLTTQTIPNDYDPVTASALRIKVTTTGNGYNDATRTITVKCNGTVVGTAAAPSWGGVVTVDTSASFGPRDTLSVEATHGTGYPTTFGVTTVQICSARSTSTPACKVFEETTW